MKLTEALSQYVVIRDLSQRSEVLYRHSLGKFGEFLGHEPTVADLTTMKVAEFLRWRALNTRAGKPISQDTVTKDRDQILAVWRWMRDEDLIAGKPPALKRKKKVERTPRAYTANDMARLIMRARKRHGRTGGLPSRWWWSSILYAQWVCGARIGELMLLRWKHVDLETCRVVFTAETRKGKTADISHALPADLCRQLEEHRRGPDDLVWPWDRKQSTSIYQSLRSLCRTAGVAYLPFHAVRKSSASYVHAGGGDATAHLGHHSTEMTRTHYLAPAITQTRSALDYLPALDLGEEAEFVPDAE
jgi:integrase